MLKTYRHLQYLKHTIFVTVDGVQQAITFEGGTRQPVRIHGNFTTANLKLQEAIEKHPGYGKQFIGPNEPVKKPKLNPELTGEEPVEVGNFQQAKKYILDNFEVDPSRVQNKELLEKTAAELGVQFIYK